MDKLLETSPGVQRNSSCFFLEFCGLSDKTLNFLIADIV